MSKVPKPVRVAVSLAKAYKTVFGSPDGELVLIDLIKKGGILDGAYEGELEGWKTGRRSAVLDILQTLRFDEGRLLELVQRRLEENPEEE